MDTPDYPEDPHVFALAGLPGSGKSTAADIITSELEHRFEKAIHAEVSDFCRTLYEERVGGETDDNSLGQWTAKLKEENGRGYILREMSQTLYNPKMPHIAISGLRSPEEAEAVRDVFGEENVTVVAIWTLPDLRFERKYGDRPSPDHEKWDEFQERNQREIHDWNCVEFFMHEGPADYVVPNNGGLMELETDAINIMHNELYGGPVFSNELPEPPFSINDPDHIAQYL